jgi:20S proteasome alpha/beta subunit
MTIIAGFFAQDGVLLAADTMHTDGTRIHRPKLSGFSLNVNTPEVCSLAFALAGHENNAKMAIEDCVEGLEDCPPGSRSLKEVRRILRHAVKEINDKYVDSRPDSERADYKFELIIAARLPLAGGLHMFKSSGSNLLSAEPYHCAGVGAYLGDYLMRNMFSPSMRIRDATLLAIQAFGAAKTYDSNCGGDTQFLTITENGAISDVVPYNISTSESYIGQVEELTRKLLFHIANKEMDEHQFDQVLATFADQVRIIRAFWTEKTEQYFERILPRSNANSKGKQDPQSTKDDPSPPQPLPESRAASDES